VSQRAWKVVIYPNSLSGNNWDMEGSNLGNLGANAPNYSFPILFIFGVEVFGAQIQFGLEVVLLTTVTN